MHIHKERAIGTKTEIIPGKLTKICYRDGQGCYPEKGDTVEAFYIAYQTNGKQIDNRMRNPAQFTVGVGRLIQGLEIALMKCRKNEKFTLIIDGELGYKFINLPKQEEVLRGKIFIEMIIVRILSLSLDKISETDSLVLLHRKYQQANQLLQKNEYDKALEILSYYSTKSIKNAPLYNCHIRLMLIQKWAQVLIYQGKLEEALQANKKSQLYTHQNSMYMYTNAEIYRLMNDRANSIKWIKKYYDNDAHKDGQKKRRYIQFLKKIGEVQMLKSTSGYNYQKDIISKINQNQINTFQLGIHRRSMLYLF